jgi:DNA-binding response OmpR family regulator
MIKKRILIVDDELELTGALTREFLRLGFDVREANLGSSAPEIADAWLPDLILLDVQIPDMPGDEVAAKIRSNARTRDTKIVFITGLAKKSEQASRDNKTGKDYMLAKPIGFDELHKYLKANSLL